MLQGAAHALAPSCSPPMHSLYRFAAILRPQQARRLLCSTAAVAAPAAEAVPATAAAAAARQQQQAAQATPFDSWAGLKEWRARGFDARAVWGPGKEPVVPSAPDADAEAAAALAAATAAVAAQPAPASLAEAARAVLRTADPLQKATLTFRAWAAYKAGALPVGEAPLHEGPPARPPLPELVPPRRIPSMDASQLPKSVYMLHNLTHVELNAIDLAWDTVLRFSGCGLPEAFYADFARVADEESRHLAWCLQRLRELGYAYGCMPAHNLLWEGAEASQEDLGARLAIVPMSQEARGLDAGDRLVKRLVGLGDNRTAAIVRRIALEERAHVAVGVTWFSAVCHALGVDAGPAFRGLLLDLCPGLLKGPFNDAERELVGLPRAWYDTRCWTDEPSLQAAAEAAVKAAARGEAPPAAGGSAGGSGSSGEGSEGSSPAAAAALAGDPERLRQVARRLAVMLDLEVANASSA